MEEKNQSYPEHNHSWKNPTGRSGRIFAGFIIILVGSTLLVRELNIISLPYWLFSWKTLLIVVGLFIGAKSGFSNIGWIFPFFIGLFFLLDELYPSLSFSTYLWPVIIIVAGLFVMFGPRKGCDDHAHRFRSRRDYYPTSPTEPTTEDRVNKDAEYLDSVSVFGGIKKNIISKDFKGGEIVTIFGGSEYNLTHADIQGDVRLEVVQLFGGTRLIIPPHWELKSELVAVLGSVDDKRPVQAPNGEPRKRLILEGTSIFGGIDIRSY